MKNSNLDFGRIIADMKAHGMKTPKKNLRFQIPNAKKLCEQALNHFIGFEDKKAVWLPVYDELVSWLTDNQGKGLFMYGSVGQGKTVFGRFVIPSILLGVKRLVVSSWDVSDMSKNIDSIKKKKIASLDDIGTEATVFDYGNKREAFAEIIDNAEKTGQILIITSNLGKDALNSRYGDRVFDRLLKTTKRVVFEGKSLRK